MQNRQCVFGEIVNDEMVLNENGEIAIQCWLEIPQHFPDAVLYEYVIMPNHIHGIIQLTENDITTVGAKNLSSNNIMTKNISFSNNAFDIRAKDFSPL